MTNRRTRFRDFMNRLDPKGDPEAAIELGWYVRPPSGTGHAIASRLEIDPSSSHLIIGGVGTGKTTELHFIKRTVAVDVDTKAFYVDVPSEHKATQLREGVLLALAWVKLAAYVKQDDIPEDAQKVYGRAETAATGWWAEPWEVDQDSDDYLTRVPGLIERPERDRAVAQIIEGLRMLVETSKSNFVMLYDGLDRSRATESFLRMVLLDVKELERLGIGCVVVGPPDVQLDLHRQVAERFSTFHFHGAADFVKSEGMEFMRDVLRARNLDGLFAAESLHFIATYSGGILRDLIALARDAAGMAYAQGSDGVNGPHVEAAADQFGRTLLLGIAQTTVKRLLELKQIRLSSGALTRLVEFTAATSEDVDLIVRRIIIQIPAVPPRFLLHPTIVPLLGGLSGSR